MPIITFKANRSYPSIPTVGNDVESHTVVLNIIKHALEIHERRTPNAADSFVRLRELVDLGLITVEGEQLNLTSGGPDASVSEHTHPISEVDQLPQVLNSLVDADAALDVRVTCLEDVVLALAAQRIDEVGTLFYIGTADAGTLDAASTWRIKRVTFTTPGQDDSDTEWADGNTNFDNIWDNRAALSYT